MQIKIANAIAGLFPCRVKILAQFKLLLSFSFFFYSFHKCFLFDCVWFLVSSQNVRVLMRLDLQLISNLIEMPFELRVKQRFSKTTTENKNHLVFHFSLGFLPNSWNSCFCLSINKKFFLVIAFFRFSFFFLFLLLANIYY